MGWPWKKIGTTLKHVVTVGALFEPHLAMVKGAVEAVERSMVAAKGTDKKAAVLAISDEFLNTDLGLLTPEQVVAFKAARSAWVDAYVAMRNAEATMQAAIASVKDGD